MDGVGVVASTDADSVMAVDSGMAVEDTATVVGATVTAVAVATGMAVVPDMVVYILDTVAVPVADLPVDMLVDSAVVVTAADSVAAVMVAVVTGKSKSTQVRWGRASARPLFLVLNFPGSWISYGFARTICTRRSAMRSAAPRCACVRACAAIECSLAGSLSRVRRVSDNNSG